MISFGFTTWNYEEELMGGSLTNFDLVDLAAQMGCTSIEWMGYHLPLMDEEELRKLSIYHRKRHLAVSAVDVRNMRFGGKWYEVRQDMEIIKLCIQAAKHFTCPHVLVFLGYFPNEAAHAAQLQKDIELLREAAAFASPQGVTLVVENHRVYLRLEPLEDEGEAEDIRHVCNTVGLADCMAAPDSDNFFKPIFRETTTAQQEKTYRDFESLLPIAGHVHVKAKGFDAQGKHNQADYAKIAGSLSCKHYRGSLSIELMKPAEGNKTEVIAQAIQILKELTQDA